MKELSSWEYAAVFCATATLCALFTPLALRLAVRRGILDAPSEIKAQSSAVPYLGGAAITMAFAVAVLSATMIRPPEHGRLELAVLLGCAIVLALMGLVDDLRGLSPYVRLAVEIAAGVVVWATPAAATLTPSDTIDLIVTVGWIVGVTNAFNLLDNMDGLSAGVAAIAGLSLYVVAASNGQFLVAVLALALSGCAVGFLRRNFHPAQIYMGDAGALFFGFMLAVLSLKVELHEVPPGVAMWVPIVILGVPLFDTTLVVINRLLHRRNPMLGGRDHVSHRLVFVGVPVPVAVTIIYVTAISLGLLALAISESPRHVAFLLVGWLAALALLFGGLLSRVPVYATSKRRHLMLQEVSKHEDVPPADDAAGPVVAPG